MIRRLVSNWKKAQSELSAAQALCNEAERAVTTSLEAMAKELGCSVEQAKEITSLSNLQQESSEELCAKPSRLPPGKLRLLIRQEVARMEDELVSPPEIAKALQWNHGVNETTERIRYYMDERYSKVAPGKYLKEATQ